VPAVLAAYVRDPDALARDWESLSFDSQRAIVTAVLEAVVVGPAARGKGFDPNRVLEVRWRS
jgi:hypothetical protein